MSAALNPFKEKSNEPSDQLVWSAARALLVVFWGSWPACSPKALESHILSGPFAFLHDDLWGKGHLS